MADREQTTSLTDALVELSFVIQATLARLANEYEVSLRQVRLLGILRDREPGIVELADVLSLDKSSVSGLVDRAERRGLVQRASSKRADGRAIRVVLTRHGRTMVNQFGARQGLLAHPARATRCAGRTDRHLLRDGSRFGAATHCAASATSPLSSF
jgi:DNA-binding MarR family transcriptional regulator